MTKITSRHYVFAGLFAVVTVSMMLNYSPDTVVSAETQKMYDFVESLPAGSTLIISFDHEASSLPEIRPLALAVLRHAFRNDIKLIGTALLSEGTGVGYRLMQQTANEFNKSYGVDYVYLGFKPQYIAAILSMGESISRTYPVDYLGKTYSEHPMLKDIDTYNDIAGVISIADGSLTTHWIEYGNARFGVRISAALTAAMVTTYDPYLSSGQLEAIVGGLRGAAEYEKLLNIGGGGKRGMLAQTASHLYVLILVIAGNVMYFRRRSSGRGNT